MRKLISIAVLAVYTVVMAHNFIPHHHHSIHTRGSQHCELEKSNKPDCNHKENADHSIHIIEDCCLAHHQHAFCSFDEELVLMKWISLSDLFLPSTEIIFAELAPSGQKFSDTYLPFQTQNPHCRDVQLRGPPQLS
uniref:hypothetical protein n=1 Tax=uncultured Draconibacterium sp. TaxID=1573823 RepID=UPI003217C1AD